ncbi:hypothetical protein RB195_022268 [Necator americanus]|uniref:G-protein coupled receptors family 1 profile domain-containing protein n=1 Tax=Necator americanus TaxID=51031 RepID=A0ABR1EEM1_NECAM
MPFTLLLLDTETNNFTSFYKLLKEWLHEQCERSGTSFFKRSSYAKGSSYSLRCNRAGTYEKATTSNATSSKKDVISCSCFMNVHIADDGKVNIKGCLGHVGHDIEPALLRLNNTQELLRTLLEEHSMDYILRLLKRDYSAKTSRLWFVDRNANSRAEFLVELLIRAVEDLADSAEIRDRRRLAASSFRVQQSTKCHRWALKHYENRPEKVKRVAEKKWELQGKDVADKYQVCRSRKRHSLFACGQVRSSASWSEQFLFKDLLEALIYMWDALDGRSLTAEALARAAIVVAVEVLLLGTSFLNICVIFTTADLYDVIGCYLISLSVADLLAALFIVPLSLYSTLDPNWRFMGDNSLVCKGTAYLQIALFCSTVYTFAWICIDRYSAMMKPSRYADQSLTRFLLKLLVDRTSYILDGVEHWDTQAMHVTVIDMATS